MPPKNAPSAVSNRQAKFARASKTALSSSQPWPWQGEKKAKIKAARAEARMHAEALRPGSTRSVSNAVRVKSMNRRKK